MKAYSPDLRAKIMAQVDAGMSKSEAARVFGVSRATIKRYAALQRAQGTLDPKPHLGRPPTIGPDQKEHLRVQVTEHPAAYLDEHCALWEAEHGVPVSRSIMSRAIIALGFTRKKGRLVPVSGTRTDAASGTGSS